MLVEELGEKKNEKVQYSYGIVLSMKIQEQEFTVKRVERKDYEDLVLKDIKFFK